VKNQEQKQQTKTFINKTKEVIGELVKRFHTLKKFPFEDV